MAPYVMENIPPGKPKKAENKFGELEKRRFLANQAADQRRRELATRSTLSRLRNRKSDLK
jgi:hypothetical protein